MYSSNSSFSEGNAYGESAGACRGTEVSGTVVSCWKGGVSVQAMMRGTGVM